MTASTHDLLDLEAGLGPEAETPGPAIVQWPDDGVVPLTRLREHGLPRLVFIAAGSLPPTLPEDCVEEWIWLPATAIELANREALLRRRCSQHAFGPALRPSGHLSFHGRTTVIDVQDTPVLGRLIDDFQHPVGETDLWTAAGSDGPQSQLRPLIARLRRPLRAVGLEIQRVPRTGYRLIAP